MHKDNIIAMLMKCEYKFYWFSADENVIIETEEGCQPILKIFQYRNSFDDKIYVVWVDDLYEYKDENRISIRLGWVNNSYVKNGLTEIVPVTDNYGKIKILTELVDSI